MEETGTTYNNAVAGSHKGALPLGTIRLTDRIQAGFLQGIFRESTVASLAGPKTGMITPAVEKPSHTALSISRLDFLSH